MTRRPNTDWSFLPAEATPGRHGVYIVHDAAGGVLYVGHTRDLRRRLARGHRYTAAWFEQMSSIDFTPCDGLTEARALEKTLIAEHRPAANVKDVLSPPVPGRPLPDYHVARLVELHEAMSDAHLWHRERERVEFDNYVSLLREAGWTLASIGHALKMTRQAISKRHVEQLDAAERRVA